MALTWRKCLVCDGTGHITLMQTRVKMIDNVHPMLPDETEKCPICKGTGQIYTKIAPPKPWGFFRKDKK